MIKAIILNKDGGTLVTGFPCDIYNLYRELHSVGIMKTPSDAKLTDNEDDPISVKLYSDSDFGNHLIQILNEQNSLEDANTAAYVVSNANELIHEDLEQQIIHDQYCSVDELYADIRQMTYDAGSVSETFYFPLMGNIYEGECGDIYTVGNLFLVECEDKIREALEKYMEGDTQNMAEYYHEAGNEKLLSADWNLAYFDGELFGRVDILLTEAFTAEETELIREWICGQNSDGAGEGFEQQDIETEDGTLNVSFWHSGDDYFVYTQSEMDEYIENKHRIQLGGM